MKKRGMWLVMLVALLPFTALAQTAGGSWQVYTIANGLREWPSYTIAPDGSGGAWVGHISGGRGIARGGGLSHVRVDGAGQAYTAEPFQSCSSVDALAAAPDGMLWMRLSGYHDYGSVDYLGSCAQNYGTRDANASVFALGFIGADGAPQMLPKEQLPANVTSGLEVDAYGRLWIGTTRGAAVRESDGWRSVEVWSDGGTTNALHAAGPTLMLGSSSGAVATLTTRAGGPDQVTLLPRPAADTSRFVSDIAAGTGGIGAIIDRQFFRWDGSTWNALALPIPGGYDPAYPLYGQHLAFAGETFWIGAPQYGLYRLEGTSWSAVPAGSMPLPSQHVSDLVASSATTLLITTDRGAAQLNTAGPAPDPSGAQQAFDALWQRTNQNAQGSWVWGPRAWDERYEGYKEGPGGYRFVRYYDKARMEVSDPQADPNSPWYVTNGLLVVEMVRGQAQYSNDPALSSCPFYVQGGFCPSSALVAGDPDFASNNQTPTYSEFSSLLTGVDPRSGQRVSATFTKAQPYEQPTVGENAALASEPTTLDAYDAATRHNIPRAFWNYMRAQPTDWLYAFGHPVTEPYWIRTRIGGVEQWVLVQLFERRTLTYTPANQPAWQVEMGNVGQHYYQWRYGAYENPPWEQ